MRRTEVTRNCPECGEPLFFDGFAFPKDSSIPARIAYKLRQRGMTFKEIAEILGCSLSGVRSAINQRKFAYLPEKP